jgi:hypothetical protein
VTVFTKSKQVPAVMLATGTLDEMVDVQLATAV